MKKIFFVLLLCFTTWNGSAQITKPLEEIRESIKAEKDTIYWERRNEAGLDFSQIAFVNWNAGGNSSISGLLRGIFGRRLITKNIIWNNEMLIRYGVNKQEGRELRKTDDQFAFFSNFGYKKSANSNWFFSSRFSFNTQFTNGYNYPNTEIAISRLFAPAYIFMGIGSEYNRKDKNFNAYFSPLTLKTTIVLDQRLANNGSFGVERALFDEEGNLLRRGKRTRNELGMLLSNYWKYEFYENMMLESRLSLYSDYLNNFGNIDLDWQIQVDMKVNKYVRASVALHMIYDDDIKAKREIDGQQVTIGPKLQLKQALGIGVLYTFK
jgi:hypothetical protein